MNTHDAPTQDQSDSVIVAPLDCLCMPERIAAFPLTPGLVFDRTPDFIRSKIVLDKLSFWDRERVVHAEFSLLCNPMIFLPTRSVSNALDQVHVAQEHLNLAVLAIWLARPGPAYFPVLIGCRPSDPGSGLNLLTQRRVATYPSQNSAGFDTTDLSTAAELLPIMSGLFIAEPASSLFMAITVLWSAIHESNIAMRHSLIWIALEALFGTKEAGETLYRLAHRIALFAPSDGESRPDICKKVKKSYGLRSKFIHGSGHFGLSDDADEVPLWTERLLRHCLLCIVRSAELVSTFKGSQREEFLEGLILQTESITGRRGSPGAG